MRFYRLGVVTGCMALTSRFAEFMDLRVQKQQLLNKDLRRAAVKMIGDTDNRSAHEDRETIRKFEKVLRQQYVIETCEAGHASRHVWNFSDWYTQRCGAYLAPRRPPPSCTIENAFRWACARGATGRRRARLRACSRDGSEARHRG